MTALALSCCDSDGRGHTDDCMEPRNPWAGERSCPLCRSADWTLPIAPNESPVWRCVACHLSFNPTPITITEQVVG